MRSGSREVALAALAAGVGGGAPSTLHALLRRRDPFEATRAAGHLVAGAGTPDGRLTVAGLGIHGAVSCAWAALLVPLLRRRRHPVALGAGAGLVIAGVIRVAARRLAPPLAALPAWPQVADHVAYGALVGAVVARTRSRTAGR